MHEKYTTTPWHSLTVEETVERLGTNKLIGLKRSEAENRLQKYGRNELPKGTSRSPWRLLLSQFQNVLIIILIVGSIISLAVGHGAESLAIIVIVILSALLGFIQEYKAEQALSALQSLSAPKSQIIRESETLEIDARLLVPGDIVVLNTGDKVPADGRLIGAFNLKTNESFLTGESEAVEKDSTKVTPENTGLADQKNMMFSGATIVYGRGTMAVTTTGKSTEIGKIAGLLGSIEHARTPLQDSLNKLAKTLGLVALGTAVAIAILGIVRGSPLVEIMLFGISLAVAIVPEALPAVVTISLALGVKKMASRHALIRHLPTVEALGSTSVICTDKTGTLTKNEMTVRAVVLPEVTLNVTGEGYAPKGSFQKNNQDILPSSVPGLSELLCACMLCNDAKLIKKGDDFSILGDPTEGALIVLGEKAGLNNETLASSRPRVFEEPFSSETKRMITVHTFDGSNQAYAKGSLEAILAISKIEQGLADKFESLALEYAKKGQRVLALASKENFRPAQEATDFTLLGLAVMSDPPREEAKVAIALARKAGIIPVMITGDHPTTALSIAKELNLTTQETVITGKDLESMSDEELENRVSTIRVYARVSPEHKLRIVSAWQKQGEIVAMTGDGVNDAPALKKADIGIAMGIAGTQVAKESADMTLTDDNFASIVSAIEEGRIVFENIKKYLMYLLSSHVGEVILIATSVILKLPLPLTAVQVLFINLAVDGPPAIALALDPGSREIMERQPRKKNEKIFTKQVSLLMLTAAVWSTLVCGVLFFHGLLIQKNEILASTTTFTALILLQLFKAYSLRSTEVPVTEKPFSNKWLNIAIFGQIPFLWAVTDLKPLQKIFTTQDMNIQYWVVVIVAASTIIPVLELVKYLMKKKEV